MSTTPKNSKIASPVTNPADQSVEVETSIEDEAQIAAIAQLLEEMRQREASQANPKKAPAIMKRNVLVIGSGGREHALAWAASRSPLCGDLVVAPGNGGTPGRREAVQVDDPQAVCALAKRLRSDLVIVGPDAAIAAGVIDALTAAGIRAFGPTQAASQLEWSKVAARKFCERNSIASPLSASFDATELDAAIAYVQTAGAPLVVKADGLAAGKGVVVASSAEETIAAIRDMLVGGAHGDAGNRVVLEEVLTGEEVSLLAFCDGTTVSVMPPAQDHKTIGEGDRGANTGGMGAYAPAPICPPALVAELAQSVLQKAVTASAAEGRPFVGVLYAGLMFTPTGPKVLEFNCRFGDPEAQVLLPLLETDLLEVVDACIDGRLADLAVQWNPGAACTVVLATPGYPAAPIIGGIITGEFDEWAGTFAAPVGRSVLFHAGTDRNEDGSLRTTGGRVFAATGVGATVAEARKHAYEEAATVGFEGAQMRRDIAWRALARTTGGYAASGVNIDEGTRAVDLLKESVEKTHGSSVLAGIGSFGGAFDARALKNMDYPVLVASTDGVGTKVMLATQAKRLKGVGIDLVNHCVNDVLVQNARPMFFLDYFASSKVVAEDVAEVVKGMAEACAENDCALLGGETAEMPGVYHEGHLDLAGTLVGVVDKADLLPRTLADGTSAIHAGDVMIGIGSSGPHTSGYSLLRRIFAGLPLEAMPAPLTVPLGDALLEPHRSYLPVLKNVLDGADRLKLKALVHITGGGLLDNVPRVLPSHLGADVNLGSWPVPPLFALTRDVSGLDANELHRTLNMGVGMVAICAPNDAETLRAQIDEPTWLIGNIVERAGSAVLLQGA
jgi:phosphoribosylamine--glycine ligase/phosphoribosylaminoimidazole synthetase